MGKINLDSYGWSARLRDAFDTHAANDWLPGRVITESKGFYVVVTELGEMHARVSGSFRYASSNRKDFPVVGDWVGLRAASADDVGMIQAVLPRQTNISRKVAGDGTQEQVMCSNVDYVFIASSVDQEFNLRRIERYISTVLNSGATPVVVLNKIDLIADDAELREKRSQIGSISCDISVHFVSSLTGKNLSDLSPYFTPGKTVVLLGSSGVGKSTITNYFLGKAQQKTMSVMEKNSVGRHTTTQRHLFLLVNGGLLIDTPGMRELQLWQNEDSPSVLGFDDVKKIAENCRFSDCTHKHEPGCAVRQAVDSGVLDEARLKSLWKLQAELGHLESRKNEVGWESNLKHKKHSKLRHAVIKNNKKR